MNTAELLGKTITAIEIMEDKSEMKFACSSGELFKFYHSQDCCENVSIEDVVGELEDLIGSPLTMAEESTSNENPEGVTKEYQDSFTWTFYKFATIKGYVTVRWYGESNGYYSESVDLVRIFPKNLASDAATI